MENDDIKFTAKHLAKKLKLRSGNSEVVRRHNKAENNLRQRNPQRKAG